MDENEITQRLRDAGERPVPGEVRSTHVSQMHAAAHPAPRQKRFGRLAVAAAAFVGFAVGSTGFAMAGALPDPAQRVAHDVLAAVKVDVENPENRGRCISAAARSTTDPVAKRAAKAECPKGSDGKGRPDDAGRPAGKANSKGKGRPDHAGTPGGPDGRPHPDDPCQGPPPWAGKAGKAMTPDQKRAAQAERAACPGAEAEAPEEIEEGPNPQDQAPPDEQRQADPEAPAPEGTPPAPPTDGAPGTQDAPAVPPVETPAPAAPGEG